MGDNDDPGLDEPDLVARLTALEARIADLAQEIRTGRLVINDQDRQERLVAELVDGVMELRLNLPARPAGRHTGVLVFAVPEQADWCAGIGVQLWANGNTVGELTWWADGLGGQPPRQQ